MRLTTTAALALCLSIAPAWAIGERWGAVAMSQSGPEVGATYDALAEVRADTSALSRCSARDCVVVLRLRNMCGAVAIGDRGFRSVEEHPILRRAEGRALEACEARGEVCRVAESGCATDQGSRR